MTKLPYVSCPAYREAVEDQVANGEDACPLCAHDADRHEPYPHKTTDPTSSEQKP